MEQGNIYREEALKYALQKIPVFPTHNKKPLTERGFHDATTDCQRIRDWWNQYPHAGIGIPTGATTQRIVLDIDPDKGGEDTLDRLIQAYGPIPHTVESITGGGGRHVFFQHYGCPVRNSVGKLGPGLDIRGDGGYVIVPPSLHPSGRPYAWEWSHHPNHTPLAEMPNWLRKRIANSTSPSDVLNGSELQIISEGLRNDVLFRLGCSMRAQGVPEEGIAFALSMTNKMRCMPPLDEIEVRRIASSTTRYAPGTTDDGAHLILAPRSPHCEANMWDRAITIDVFLQQEDEELHSLIGELVYPGAITVIAGPRGMGKSLIAEALAVAASTGQTFRGSSISSVRVLFIDRDNPPHITRQRFRNWGTPSDASLSILTRNDAPNLLDTKAWQAFPVDDYKVVILDSYGAASEGVSEKEGQQTQRILATLKDLAHRGPAILVLDNTTKAATSYRGRGEKADAIDVLYEVRDITGWIPGASTDWWEHMPEAGDHNWASRASRRKGQTRLRLAFVPSKFRLGIEPDPFCLEVDTGVTPWALNDVTAEIEHAGEQAEYDRRHAERRKLEHAATQLVEELYTRSKDHPMRKKEAQEWLAANTGLTHRQAKNLLENGYNANVHPTEGKWRLESLPGQRGNAIAVIPVDPLDP